MFRVEGFRGLGFRVEGLGRKNPTPAAPDPRR